MGQKILMINGSFRKKNTYKILCEAGAILEKRGFQYEILNLSDYKINHCRGCDLTCNGNKGCNQSDDQMSEVKKKILESDALIFATPVYLSGPSSAFKAFADRTNIWFHNPALFGKPVMSVVTTEVSGIKPTAKFLNSLATGMGLRKGGLIKRTRKTFSKPLEEKEMAKFLSLLKTDKSKYKPAVGELIIFQVQKALALKFGEGNKQFWVENGWLDKTYYYKCKIGVKALLAKFIGGRIRASLGVKLS